jgi:hypothetical protein
MASKRNLNQSFLSTDMDSVDHMNSQTCLKNSGNLEQRSFIKRIIEGIFNYYK